MGSVTAVVHDQASNMKAGGHILESDWETESLKCSAHYLQFCVNEGLQLVRIVQTIIATKKLVAHFKHGPLVIHELHKRQDTMNMQHQKLQQDCPNRWNSTYCMSKCLVNRWLVAAVL